MSAGFLRRTKVHSFINTNASALAALLNGGGMTISNATLTTNTSAGVGTFSNGLAAGLGMQSGVVLTTGALSCVPGPNSSNSCTGAGNFSKLEFDFVSSTTSLLFNYMFGSEEYNEFVGSSFNDTFTLKVDGTNVAVLPGGAGVVSINNVNNGMNSAYYVDNWGTNALDMQYDGFTTMLTAVVAGLSPGTHHMEFYVADVGDSSYDSGVLLRAYGFSSVVPVPAAVWLLGSALGVLQIIRRRST